MGGGMDGSSAWDIGCGRWAVGVHGGRWVVGRAHCAWVISEPDSAVSSKVHGVIRFVWAVGVGGVLEPSTAHRLSRGTLLSLWRGWPYHPSAPVCCACVHACVRA